MSLVTCAGADVLRGRVHIGLRGAWWAELVLDRTTAPSGAVTLAAVDGLALAGTIADAGVYLEAAHVRVVGGAGKLGTTVARAFRGARLRDALDAILRGAGEAQSSTIAASTLAVSLPAWTVSGRAAGALDELAAIATRSLGDDVHWRVLGDGSVWIGPEAWTAATLPDTADIIEPHPAERRTVIGVETPALLPGVDLADVGRVVAVDHWIEADNVRTWAWTSRS